MLNRLEPVKDGDLIPVWKEICQERRLPTEITNMHKCLEPFDDIYLRVVKLRQLMAKIVQETED